MKRKIRRGDRRGEGKTQKEDEKENKKGRKGRKSRTWEEGEWTIKMQKVEREEKYKRRER